MDKKTLERFRTILVSEKSRLEVLSKRLFADDLTIHQADLADETDFAVGELNRSMAFKLRNRQVEMLTKVELALSKMGTGRFGLCDDCEEPIEPKRLEARPVSTLCIACKEQKEHRDKIYA